MKTTAEEFLKEKCHYLNDPKAVHHFTGDFVIKMIEEYASQQQESGEGNEVKVGEVLDVLDENQHYYKGADGESHIDMFKLAHAVHDFYQSNPTPPKIDEGEIDWEKLKEEFFTECTRPKAGAMSGRIKHYKIPPATVFEWFKTKLINGGNE